MSESFVPYDPAKHAGKQLYELRCTTTNGVIETSYVPVSVAPETASQVPWYYAVQAEEN